MERSLSSCSLSAAGLLFGLLLAPFSNAESLQFALVAKRVDQHFFIQVGKGCAEAAQAEGDTCLLLGPSGPAHFRRQNEALEQALDKDLDGIALSVTHSKWLAEHALKRASKPPLITFDSDLGPAEQHLRRSYVGLDNLAFGRQLGRLVQRFRPQGGRLCILSGSPQDTNLQERIQGIRQQLLRSGRGADGAVDPLNGENGWNESQRCPLYSADDQEKALIQLTTLLSTSQVDAIVTTGSWPIYQADAFRRQLGPLLAERGKRGTGPVIIMTADEPDEAQLELLDEGLVQAYLGAQSRELGRQSYRILKHLARDEPIPEKVLVGSHIYLPKASPDLPAKY